MAKAKTGILLLLAAVGIGAAVTLSKKAGDLVTGKSGKIWRVVFSNDGGVKNYEVITPEGSFGPHGELSVLRYTQTGSDQASRKITAVGTGVPVSITAAAAADFGLPFDPALMPKA